MLAFIAAPPAARPRRARGALHAAEPRRPRRFVRPRPHPLCTTIPPSSSSSSPASPDPSSSQSSGSPLLKRLAAAFIDACQPGRKPYAAAVRDFCAVALDAYRRGYTLRALDLELGAATAGGARPLQSDEVELRSVWLSLVFKTLRHIGFPGGSSGSDPASTDTESSTSSGPPGVVVRNVSPPRSISPPSARPWERDRLDDFVGNIVRSVRAGYDIKRIRLEQNLAQRNTPRTELESAILGQSTRLVVTTLSAADDALRDDGDGDGGSGGGEEGDASSGGAQ